MRRVTLIRFVKRSLFFLPAIWFIYVVTEVAVETDPRQIPIPRISFDTQKKLVEQQEGGDHVNHEENVVRQMSQYNHREKEQTENKPETRQATTHKESIFDPRANGVMQMDKLAEMGGRLAEKRNQEDFENVQLPKFNDRIDPDGPGEGGKPYEIDVKNLTADEQSKYNKGWSLNSFNQYASDLMSIHRSLPDGRSEACKEQAKTYTNDLQEISVIIIFHNEAFSIILRSVHSILSRTPEHLLREIILVDDLSTHEDIKDPLEKYFNSFPKVQIVRATKRQGLTRARLLGYFVSTAPVLVFLDSHIECFPGWAEPLLQRIHEDYQAVPYPNIEIIRDTSLALSTTIAGSRAIFFWKDLTFQWEFVPQYEKDRRKNDADPIRSPTMPGGLFAISRAFFEKLGTYDEGLDYWGGENIELSFKAWMCGGSVEMVTCSHIGHIFRKWNPIGWKKNVGSKNSVRVAEVWMDDFKNYYYERILFNLGDYGNVTSRKELRKRLNCKSFEWYLQNVYPNVVIPTQMKYAGVISSVAQPKCVDSMGGPQAKQRFPKMYPCHGMGINQFWHFSDTGQIKQDDWYMCWAEDQIASKSFCEPSGPTWQYREDLTMMHVPTGKCLTSSSVNDDLTLANCSESKFQKWKMEPRRTDVTFPTI